MVNNENHSQISAKKKKKNIQENQISTSYSVLRGGGLYSHRVQGPWMISYV